MQADLEAPKELEFPNALELKNEVLKKYPNFKLEAIEIERILEILGGESDDNCLPNKEVESLPESAPIKELQLSVRAYNCLKRGQINTIQQLLGRSPRSLLGIDKLGKVVLAEIENSLQKFGLCLLSDEKNES